MQIATPYKSGPRCADCPGHCDRGLCSKWMYSPPFNKHYITSDNNVVAL